MKGPDSKGKGGGGVLSPVIVVLLWDTEDAAVNRMGLGG